MPPWYLAYDGVRSGAVQVLLERFTMQAQEIPAVFPPPELLPSTVTRFCDVLAPRLGRQWRAAQTQ